jgi:Flp pilus assembly protein TadD
MRDGGNSTAELPNLHPQMDRQRKGNWAEVLRGDKRMQDLLTAYARIIDLMFSNQNFRFWLPLLAVTILLLPLRIGSNAIAGVADEQVCDVGADYSLGVEDYAETIRRHVEVLREHPDNALAHYHLGFALGMVGDRDIEISEYQRARALGLKNWDLFLNLGLAQPENGDLDAATESLRKAVILGEEHSESHFNLALIDQRRGDLADPERETLTALRLKPAQPEARNLLGVIYVQEGKTVRASLVWRELVREFPDYEPARANLTFLSNQNKVALGETAAVALPNPAAAVKAIKNERKTDNSTLSLLGRANRQCSGSKLGAHQSIRRAASLRPFKIKAESYVN